MQNISFGLQYAVGVVVKGTKGIKDTHTASLYELDFTGTHSVSGQSCLFSNAELGL